MSINNIGLLFAILVIGCETIRNFKRRDKSDLIYGGTARDTPIPYQIIVHIRLRWVAGRNQCGGSIVSAKWVLSAAHCFRNWISGNVTAGVLNKNAWESSWQRREIVGVCVHTEWYPNGPDMHNHDMALITFEKPFDFNNDVMSIPLARYAHEAYLGYLLEISGWGRNIPDSENLPSILQQLKMRVVENHECKVGDDNTNYFCLSAKEFAKPGELKKSGVGDSGGPAVLVKYDGPFLVGSLRGSPTGDYPHHTTFISVPEHQDWIDSVLQQNDVEHAQCGDTQGFDQPFKQRRLYTKTRNLRYNHPGPL